MEHTGGQIYAFFLYFCEWERAVNEISLSLTPEGGSMSRKAFQ